MPHGIYENIPSTGTVPAKSLRTERRLKHVNLGKRSRRSGQRGKGFSLVRQEAIGVLSRVT